MNRSSLTKATVKIAWPIFLANATVVICVIISNKIVTYDNNKNWYLIGLFLPAYYFILGLIESGRICSLIISQDCNEIDRINISYLMQICIIHVAIFLVTAAIFFVVLLLNKCQFTNFAACYFLSYLAVIIASIFNAALFAIGKNRLAFILIALSNFLMLILTYYCYFYCYLDLYSLAISTAIGYFSGAIVAVYFIIQNRSSKKLYFTKTDFIYSLSLVFSAGLPVLTTYILMPLIVFAIEDLLTSFGKSAVAAIGIVYRLQNLFIMPAIALGVASGIIINSHRKFKLKLPEDYLSKIIKLCFSIYILLSLALIIFKNFIAKLILSDIDIQSLIASYFSYYSAVYLLFCPLTTLLLIWEQTGFAFYSLKVNSLIGVVQICAAAVIVYGKYSLTVFYQLSALLILLVSSYFLWRNFEQQKLVIIKERI